MLGSGDWIGLCRYGVDICCVRLFEVVRNFSGGKNTDAKKR